jgi:LuxR family maltose regulon positive regulatory protein
LETLVAISINAVAAFARPFVLVLDDYHLVAADEIHQAVAHLLHHMPRNFHVVISTRNRPDLPLAWLKARGELSEITATDLRFSEEEAAGFLHQTMGLDLPETGVADLMARTEGWVTGLKLAALSLRGASDWPAAIERFSGRHPDLLN